MTALFVVTIVIGFLEVVSTLANFSVLRLRDREGPPFRLMVQAVGLLAAGIGGLAMTLADIGTVGFSIVTVVSLAVLLAIVYKLVLPSLNRRMGRRDRTGYVGLGATVTRDVAADGFGEVEFVDKAGNRVRLPRRAAHPSPSPNRPGRTSPPSTTSSPTSRRQRRSNRPTRISVGQGAHTCNR